METSVNHLIEHLAEALWRNAGAPTPLEEAPALSQEMCRSQARAALVAMAEYTPPTDMQDA